MRRTSPRVSGAKGQRIVEGYRAGKTIYELADEHGIYHATVSEVLVLKCKGISMRRQPPTEKQVSEMVRLYGEQTEVRERGLSAGTRSGRSCT